MIDSNDVTKETNIVFDSLTSSYQIRSHWGIVPVPNEQISNINNINNSEYSIINLDLSTEGLVRILKPIDIESKIQIYTWAGLNVANITTKQKDIFIPLSKGLYVLKYSDCHISREYKVLVK